MAPEHLFQKGYDNKTDVWALGTIYYSLMTGFHPFHAETYINLFKRITSGDWVWPLDVPFSL
jgi:serine/threonine protein kinase